MASQVHSTYQASISNDASTEVLVKDRSSRPTKPVSQFAENAAPIIAHSFEFVALPGRAQGIQAEIPTAMRHAFRNNDGFMGSMVLVSEQEARLVTVITLWTGSNRLALCGESEKRLKRWLVPYVDRWVRARRFASFVAAPDRFLAKSHPHSELTGQENSFHLQ